MRANPLVLVTRERASAQEVVVALEKRGFEPLAVPCLEIEPLEPLKDASAMLLESGGPRWLVVTSATTVRLLAEELAREGREMSSVIASLSLAAVGEKTARALSRYAPIERIVVPPSSNSVALGELLAARFLNEPSTTVLLCRGVDADEQLPQLLRHCGVQLSCFAIYRTRVPKLSDEESASLHRALEAPAGQLSILITSVVTGANLLEQVRQTFPAAERAVLASKVVAIGPGTAAGLQSLGFTKVEVPAVQSVEAMIDAL